MRSKRVKIDGIHNLACSLKLLKGGPDGVKEWNYRRLIGEAASNLSRVNLQGAFLCGIDLSGINLSGANLRESNLRFADLRGTGLLGADLRGADFHGTKLHRTDLRGARLSGANLAESRCWNTVFADTDLADVRGLESVIHEGPSTIGVDTLIKSHGKICMNFLRGCGVPDIMTEKMISWITSMKPTQFYSCFISYSTKDEEFAKQLRARMVQENLRVWFCPQNIRWGKKLHEQIDEAIRTHDKLLLVLSPNSIESEWVKTELRKAFKIERRESKRKLFPIGLTTYEMIRNWECFDADHGIDLAAEVREYFIPDFSRWQDKDSFEAAFAELLKNLKAEEPTEATHKPE